MYINIDTLVISCINTVLPQYRFNIVLQLITSCILYHCKKSPQGIYLMAMYCSVPVHFNSPGQH